MTYFFYVFEIIQGTSHINGLKDELIWVIHGHGNVKI